MAWQVVHDNRKFQNRETIRRKVLTYKETYDKIRTFTSLDVMQEIVASAKGEIAGFGGSVQTTSKVGAHTEVETEKIGQTKEEQVIDDEVPIAMPGPVLDEAGRILEEGEIWRLSRPLLTLRYITPVTQSGLWDCAKITLNLL